MRLGVAIVLAGAAIAAAVYLGSLHLNKHGHFHCVPNGMIGQCYTRYSYWVADRAAWQIPLAIVIAALGLGAAVAVARGGSAPIPPRSRD